MRRVSFGDEQETEADLRRIEDNLATYASYASGSPAPWLRDVAARGVTRSTVLERVFAGTPEAVAEDVLEWGEQAGIDYLILKFEQLLHDQETALRQLRRAQTFLERVHA
jgi:alkanesulfonate monooxygenase SsuD/methylene tetrahydromethanopterin reductase-like flavin-dependent oxidoreductase (luciferase family)